MSGGVASERVGRHGGLEMIGMLRLHGLDGKMGWSGCKNVCKHVVVV